MGRGAALSRLAPAVVAIALAGAPAARAASRDEMVRKTTRQHLQVEVQRVVLPNGLVVLLAPDPRAVGVAVWMTFRAGALHEPADRTGLAHLVEHLMFTGPTAETDYAALLERRRARSLNAETGFDRMTFQVTVPAEELPLALWATADRLGTLPGLIDPALVDRHRRVVQQERALRSVDAPYGLVDEHLFARLYGPRHPLHGNVIGAPDELARISADDVRAFVERRLVPANAVLVVVGAFDPTVARRLVEVSLGRLPAGRRAAAPRLAAPPPAQVRERRTEPLARQPRVTMAWRFPDLPYDDAVVLRLGAQLLEYMTDGAFGMRLDAESAEYGDEGLLVLSLTVPYDEPPEAVERDAEGFLRQLTRADMPVDLMDAASLALDRDALFALDTLEGRAELLTRVELAGGGRRTVAEDLDAHWQLDRRGVRNTAHAYLKEPAVVLHARPTRPIPARLDHDEREQRGEAREVTR